MVRGGDLSDYAMQGVWRSSRLKGVWMGRDTSVHTGGSAHEITVLEAPSLVLILHHIRISPHLFHNTTSVALRHSDVRNIYSFSGLVVSQGSS